MSVIDIDREQAATVATVRLFFTCLNDGDLDAARDLLAPQCVFETAAPAPDGERFVGADTVRDVFARMFAEWPGTQYELEDLVATDERCIVRWNRRWKDADGTPRHHRGVDVFTLRGGKITEKLAYVKA